MPPYTETHRLPLAFQALKTDLGASPQWTCFPPRSGRVQRALWIGERAGALANRVAALLRSAQATWRQHRRARAMEAVLRTLDERTLRDIGLHRSDISSASREAAADDGLPWRARTTLWRYRLPM